MKNIKTLKPNAQEILIKNYHNVALQNTFSLLSKYNKMIAKELMSDVS